MVVEGSIVVEGRRVSSTADRDSMVEEPRVLVTIEPEDLRQATAVAAVARVAEAPEIIEYWKSAPYLLNFMRDYALKRALKARERAKAPALIAAIAAVRLSCLDRDAIDSYRPLSPPNGRMRALMADVFAGDLDQRLWMPPSLPYYGGAQSDGGTATKALVFSSWSMVPMLSPPSFPTRPSAGWG